MRRTWVPVLVLTLILSLAAPALAATGIRVFVGQSELTFDVAPFVESGRTLVPLRALAEALGFGVQYDDAEKKITLTRADTTIILWVDSQRVVVNGKEGTIDVPAKVKNGRTFVPVRFIAENLGAAVSWDAATQSVKVSPAGAAKPQSDPAARALLEKAMQQQQAFADQKGTGRVMFGMTMNSPDVPGGSFNFSIPMDFNIHVYQQEMLMSVTASPPPGIGEEPISISMAAKGGKLYVQDPDTQQWTEAGDFDPGDLSGLGAVTGMEGVTDLLQLQQDMYANAIVTLGGTAELDGVTTTQINVAFQGNPFQEVFDAVLGSMAPSSGEVPGVKFESQRFSMSLWVNPDTGFTHKVSMDIALTMNINEGGQTAAMSLAITGEIRSTPVSEPIQFPDLSGAAQP